MNRTILLATAAVIFPLSPAGAQTASPSSPAVTDAATGGGSGDAASDAADPPVPGDAAKAHPDTDQAIVVTGVKRTAGDVLGRVSVVHKEHLTRDVRPSIG